MVRGERPWQFNSTERTCGNGHPCNRPCRCLLDDNPLRIARAAGNFSVDVVFLIAATRQPAFPISERPYRRRTRAAVLRSAVGASPAVHRPLPAPCVRSPSAARRSAVPAVPARKPRALRQQLDGVRPTLRRTARRCDSPEDAARRERVASSSHDMTCPSTSPARLRRQSGENRSMQSQNRSTPRDDPHGATCFRGTPLVE